MRIALAIAAGALACGLAAFSGDPSTSPEAIAANSILEAAQVPAIESFSIERLNEKITVEQDRSGLNRGAVLTRLFKKITEGATGNSDAVLRVGAWVQRYFVHPMYTPLRANGEGVYDPVQLLQLRRAQCGQVNRVMLDILAAGGYRGRVVQLKNHQGAEVFYDGAWHYTEADSLDGGRQFVDGNGQIPSAEAIFKNPSLADGLCYSCETLKFYNQVPDEEWNAYKQRNPEYSQGGRWKMVFSVKPLYYEKDQGTSDPEYGWLDYKTYK
jgi:hypothetical protein